MTPKAVPSRAATKPAKGAAAPRPSPKSSRATKPGKAASVKVAGDSKLAAVKAKSGRAPVGKTPTAKAPTGKTQQPGSAGKAASAGPVAAKAKAPARATKSGAGSTFSAGVIKVVPRVEAPKKVQREYKKWLERLIALRRRLVVEGERLGEEGLKALEQEVSVDHMADYGSDSYEQDTTLALIENKSDALRDVDEAIRRIEVRTYGLCEECEQLIPHARLEVIPHARFCVPCQSKREDVFPA